MCIEEVVNQARTSILYLTWKIHGLCACRSGTMAKIRSFNLVVWTGSGKLTPSCCNQEVYILPNTLLLANR